MRHKKGFPTYISGLLGYKGNIIILLGRQGIKLVALTRSAPPDIEFIDYATNNYLQGCFKFIAKHPYYQITLLLDHNECYLKHETFPILNSIVSHDLINRFIAENYKLEDIVGYNIHEINNQTREELNVCLAASPMTNVINELVKYVINNSLIYGGVYFLSLEFVPIIDHLLKITNNTHYQKHLQILTTITESSGIKCIVKYKKNIINEETVNYPPNKSDLYIQGCIEQTVRDQLLFCKQFIKTSNVKVCIIFLLDTSILHLVSKLDFDSHKIIAIPPQYPEIENRFFDTNFIALFDQYRTYLASNKALRVIRLLSFINHRLFPPLVGVFAIIIIMLAGVQYYSLRLESNISKLLTQDYRLFEEYRHMKAHNLEFGNIGDLVDLYNTEQIINKQPATPQTDIKALINLQTNNFKIRQLTWQIINPVFYNLPKSNLEISVKAHYTDKIDTKDKGQKCINEYLNNVRAIFPNYKIKHKKTHDIYEYANRTIIPTDFVIEGRIGETMHAK